MRHRLIDGGGVMRWFWASLLLLSTAAPAGEIAHSLPVMQLAQAGAAKAPGNLAAGAQAELAALVNAAKAEGEVNFYTAATENVAKRASDAFTAKYGIKASFIRLGGVLLLQRYSAEAETGKFGADLFLNASNTATFVDEAVKKGWIETISAARLPVVTSGEFPAAFNRGTSAIVQLGPWLFFYNTDRVKGADIPKDWPDLLHPRWKGQILMPHVSVSNAYLDLYVMLHEKYGDAFFNGLRAQGLRTYGSSVAAIQALAAGEGSVALPTIEAAVQAFKAKGAPLDTVTPDATTGVEMQLMLTARGKSKNPNAARLFANYIMSREGNTVLNNDPGGVTMYDTTRLPRQYVSPRPDALARKDQIYKLLGQQ